MSNDTVGYLYCMSNESMPGILKVGMTERTPDARLREANSSDTWRPPTPYRIEFAKKVSNPYQKEKTLHVLLEQYTERINLRREFFRVSPEEVHTFFDLIDGEMWEVPRQEQEEEEQEEEEEETTPRVKPAGVKGCRDMAKCFTHGQRIRHTIGINKTWIGTYDSSSNRIVYDGKSFSLYKFARTHLQVERPDRSPAVNAWKDCACEIDGKWVSTYSLPD
jgi:hypothetical protein